MNWERIEGNWDRFSDRVRERWDKLSTQDMDRIQGKRAELEVRLREAYGLEREQARKDVDDFCKSL